MKLCPFVKPGEIIPWGLSRAKGSNDARSVLRLCLPLFPWYGSSYRINVDDIVVGWWLLTVLIVFERLYSGIGLRIKWGNSSLHAHQEARRG